MSALERGGMAFLLRLFGRAHARDNDDPPLIGSAPFPVTWIRGTGVAKRVRALRDEIAPLIPIVLGNQVVAEQCIAYLAQAGGAGAQPAAFADPGQWLERRAAEDPFGYQIENGEWVDLMRQSEFRFVPSLTDGPASWLAVAHMKALDSAEVLGLLRFGGWNECPPTEVHMALAAMWAKSFGSRLAVVLPDALEFTVDSPPRTQADALALARQQFLYCPDLVQQGTGTLSGLAATVLNAPVWSFWWD